MKSSSLPSQSSTPLTPLTSAAVLTKKEKGRLKKLHSKLSSKNNTCTAKISGIQSNEDALEYQSLVSKKLKQVEQEIQSKQQQQQQQQQQQLFVPNGPSIHIRRSNTDKEYYGNNNHPRMTEGDDHRNILNGILFHANTNAEVTNSTSTSKKKQKKRKRMESTDGSIDTGADTGTNANDADTKDTTMINNGNDNDNEKKVSEDNERNQIPSWANIHNPALVQSVAVLEFNIRSLPSKTALESELESKSESKSKTANIHLVEPILDSNILTQLSSKSYIPDSKNTININNVVVKHPKRPRPRHVMYTKMRLFQDSIQTNIGDDGGNNDDDGDDAKSKSNNQRPKHMTNVLLYSEKKHIKKQNDNVNDNDNNDVQKDNNSISHLYSKIEKMILSQRELMNEGYPLHKQDSGNESDNSDGSNNKNEQNNNDDEGNKMKNLILKHARKIHGERQQTQQNVEEKVDGNITMKSNSLPFTQKQAQNIIYQLKIKSTNDDHHHSEEDEEDDDGDDKKDDKVIDSRMFVATFLQQKDIRSVGVEKTAETLNPRIYAIDCEMVRTTIGSELARISMIQLQPTEEDPERYTVILDSFVKPKNTILNYLTKYSGITHSIMRDATTTLEEIQATLLSLICKDDILVGHSLENDLIALRLVHEKVIDTAVLFRNDGRKHSLKHLSSILLQRKIQQGITTQSNGEQGQKPGHDSVEDASASLVLAVRRAKLGDDKFRIYDKRNHKKNLMETVTKIRRKDSHCQPLFFQRNKGPLLCLGPNEWVKEHVGGRHQTAANVLQCDNINSSSIKAVSSYLRPGSRNASLLWAKICVDARSDKEYKQKIDTLLSQVLDTSSINTVFLVVVQCGYDEAKNLFKQRRVAKDPRSTLGWTDAQEKIYRETLEKSRYCDAYWIGGAIG